MAKLVEDLARNDGISEYAIHTLLSHLDVLESSVDGFGFCLSSSRDLLSQWRGYADNGSGVAIGFNEEYFRALSDYAKDKETTRFKLEEVVYDIETQKEILRPFYEKILEPLKSIRVPNLGLLTSDQDNEQEIKRNKEKASELVFSTMMLFPVLFRIKSGAFAEEREKRLLAYLTRNGSEDTSFYALEDKIVPFCDLDLKYLDKPIINEIILGPKNQTPEFIVKSILDKNEFYGVQLSSSEAPYR